jgi:hypothetical protein
MNTFKTIALNFLPANFFRRVKILLTLVFFVFSFIVMFVFKDFIESEVRSIESISLRKSFENFFLDKYKSHQEKIFTYASWEEIWNSLVAKKEEKVYFAFQQDKSILDRYDFFAIYLNLTKPFIVLKNPRTKTEFKIDPKLLNSLFNSISLNSEITQTIVPIESEYYLITVSGLKDDAGKPQQAGIMIFAESLNEIIASFEKTHSVQLTMIQESDKTIYKKFQVLILKKFDSEVRFLIQSDNAKSLLIPFLIFWIIFNGFFILIINITMRTIEKEYN